MGLNVRPAVPSVCSECYTAEMTCPCATVPDLHTLRREVSILEEILHRLGMFPEDLYASGQTYSCACEEAEALTQRLARLKETSKETPSEVSATEMSTPDSEVHAEVSQEPDITRPVAPVSKRRRTAGAKR